MNGNNNPLTIDINDVPQLLNKKKRSILEQIKRKITGSRFDDNIDQDEQDNFFEKLFISYSPFINPSNEIFGKDRMFQMYYFKNSCSLDYWNWFENLCKANNGRDIDAIRDIWIFLVDRFNINETKKFREIKVTIQELEKELEKVEFKSDNVLILVRELKTFYDRSSVDSNFPFKVTGSFFSKKINNLVNYAEQKLKAGNDQVTSPSNPPIGGSHPSSSSSPLSNAIKTVQTNAILEIETELTKTPSIYQELDPTYRDYKNHIKNQNSEPGINDFCQQVLSDIRNKRVSREELEKDELAPLIKQAQKENDSVKLAKLINDIKTYHNKPIYLDYSQKINDLVNKQIDLSNQETSVLLTNLKKLNIKLIEKELKALDKSKDLSNLITKLAPENQNFVNEINLAGEQDQIETIKNRVSTDIAKVKATIAKEKKNLLKNNNDSLTKNLLYGSLFAIIVLLVCYLVVKIVKKPSWRK
ncbi:hypothetical protein [endosymbiont GvMRE of Glomus versiforme]|uniref:hypothetical protein n=1 Tax=endosymbiont GvMRE of Glomus versiforme TaxID=2039283 RepID=UPI000ED7A640|nr:hypothetical protein [endosymbiont GvMRE of Glomus versiforme]RHZ35398.1 hypothetical protein GvMRE_IIg556 [endosymbiont GvMRE of Glomus versiforme]